MAGARGGRAARARIAVPRGRAALLWRRARGSAHTRIGRRAGDSLGATALRARAGAPRPRPMSDILTLLQGSRQLQAEIHDESQLPPVARSLQQIQEETRALAVAGGEGAGADASTYRFLATHGVDALALDPSELALVASAEAADAPAAHMSAEAWKGNIEGMLEHEQRQILLQVRRAAACVWC